SLRRRQPQRTRIPHPHLRVIQALHERDPEANRGALQEGIKRGGRGLLDHARGAGGRGEFHLVPSWHPSLPFRTTSVARRIRLLLYRADGFGPDGALCWGRGDADRPSALHVCLVAVPLTSIGHWLMYGLHVRVGRCKE